MKKSIVIAALVLICFGIKAFAQSEDISYVKNDDKVYVGQDMKMGPVETNNISEDICYVKTADKVFFGQNMKIGLVKTKISTAEGSVTEVKNNKIIAYMHENKLYELLPVVCERNDTVCYAMMEYITSRSGLRLYRYCCYDGGDSKYGYFVFKNNKLYLRVDQNNALAILPFFGVEVI